MFNTEEFKNILFQELTQSKYKWLFGNENILSNKIKVELIIANSYESGLTDYLIDYNAIVEIFIQLILTKLLKNINYKKFNNLDSLFIKHDNIQYFTNDIDFYHTDSDYIHYLPFIDNTITIDTSSSICDLENHIDNITFENNRVELNFNI